MADVCGIVNTAVYNRLSDATIGFNANYAAILGSNPPFVVNWATDGTSLNFCLGLLPPDLIEESSPITYPALTLSADLGNMDQPGQRILYQQFSGHVQANIQAILSWEEDQIRDFESWPNAVVNAMYATVNNRSQGNTWAAGVSYNGDMQFRKSPVIMAGNNWRRQVLFPLAFRVMLP